MRPFRLVLPAALAALAACSDSTGPNANHVVTLSFSTVTSPGVAASRAPSFDVIVGGGTRDSIVIDTAQVVLRDVELKTTTSLCAANDSASVAGEDDDCEELHLGPTVVNLPLTAGADSALGAILPAGTYREVEFELHKASSEDTAFVAAHPELRDASVRVTGSYRGQRFVFKSAVNEEMELEFSPAVVVGAGGANVTVHVDVASWFTDTDGSTIAPTSANGARIGDRIKASFDAFGDDDRDGDEN